MKRAKLFMKKLWLENERFTDNIHLKNMCRELEVEYDDIIRYLLGREYLIRIFRGIFYVRSPEEIKMKKNDLNYPDFMFSAASFP